jgi:DNA mismatch repair protein MutH
MRGPDNPPLLVVTAPLNQVAHVDYEAEHVRWYQRPLLWCDVDEIEVAPGLERTAGTNRVLI